MVTEPAPIFTQSLIAVNVEESNPSASSRQDIGHPPSPAVFAVSSQTKRFDLSDGHPAMRTTDKLALVRVAVAPALPPDGVAAIRMMSLAASSRTALWVKEVVPADARATMTLPPAATPFL